MRAAGDRHRHPGLPRGRLPQAKSGLLVPLHDPARLADAIEQLVVDFGLRQRMGAAGRRKAEAEFDDRAVVSKTIDAYERVLVRATSSTRRRTPWSARRPS